MGRSRCRGWKTKVLRSAFGNLIASVRPSGRMHSLVAALCVASILAAARQFGARWIVLDQNRPEPLAGIYAAPDSVPGLKRVAAFGPIYLLKITSP